MHCGIYKRYIFSLSCSNLHISFQSKFNSIMYVWPSPVALMVKNLPANTGSGVQSLGREDHLEKNMEIHSSILAWRIP